MESDRWKQVDSLLQSALECSREDRDAFLRRECEGDEALERELRSLLALEPKAASFLESPAIELAARDLARWQIPNNGGPPGNPDLPAGKIVSHYRIIGTLGRAGM